MRISLLAVAGALVGMACGVGPPADLAKIEADSVGATTSSSTATSPDLATSPTEADVASAWLSATEGELRYALGDLALDELDFFFIDVSNMSSSCQGLADLIIPNPSDPTADFQVDRTVDLLSTLDSAAGAYLQWIATEAGPTSDPDEVADAFYAIEQATFRACGYPLLQAGDGLSLARFCGVGELEGVDPQVQETGEAKDCNRSRLSTRLPCFVPLDPEPADKAADLFVRVACGLEFDLEVEFTIDGWKIAR